MKVSTFVPIVFIITDTEKNLSKDYLTDIKSRKNSILLISFRKINFYKIIILLSYTSKNESNKDNSEIKR